jgi:hypothetical protein
MKLKYKKSLSMLVILVILLSYSIIPVSAASDYYESTYNGYNYDCRSELYSNELYGEINYAGTSKISTEASFRFFNNENQLFYQSSVFSLLQTSSASVAALLPYPFVFKDAYYIYTIGINTVYTVGLIY